MGSPRLVVVSGFSAGLFSFSFDDESGDILSKVDYGGADDNNMAFTTFDENTGNLYAVHEIDNFGDAKDSGAVSRWKRDDNGVFVRQEVVPSLGTDPTHLVLDPSRRLLWVANYMGGSLAVFRFRKDGGELTLLFQDKFSSASGVVKDRQEAPHPHGTCLYKDRAFLADLGGDKIYRYRVREDEKDDDLVHVERTGVTDIAAGNGPRHLVADVAKGRVYVLNELRKIIDVFKVAEESDFDLKLLCSIPYVVEHEKPETKQYGAEIALHSSGRFLYISNRGDGAVVVFQVLDGEDGSCLKQIQTVATAGTWPRHFAITTKFVLVADQFKNNLDVFEIDGDTGMLAKKEEFACGDSPSMILLV